nr:hypothetical protein [Sphingopyxis sp. 113P3]
MKPLFNMLPCLALSHSRNRVDGHAIILGNLGQGFPTSSTPAYFPNRLFIEAGQIVPLANPIGAISYRQKLVIGSRYPLQIIQPVVFFVCVFVVHLRKIVGILKERHRDEAMNEGQPRLSLSAKKELLVPPLAAERDEKISARFAVHSSGAAPSAHFENMGKVSPMNRLPNFFHNNALSKSGKVVNEASSS